jgi:uncharacterized protein (DUF2141 family)
VRFGLQYQRILLMATTLLPLFRALPQTPAPGKNQIEVQIIGLRNSKGHVRCSLFSSAEDFPKKTEKATGLSTADISDGRASCEFKDIPPGTYAIAAFHDENSNGRLDTNFMGIPREGVGASNGATGHLGPPKFEAAAFHFSGGQLNLEIRVNYL